MQRDPEIHNLAQLIAIDLGWKYSPRGDDDERANIVKGGMRIDIRRDYQHKDKVSMSSWDWPTYSTTERGTERINQVSPRDLWDPKEEAPDISCSISRGHSAIAKDMERRLIPNLERIWMRCKERADNYQASYDKARRDWIEICRVLNADPEREVHYGTGIHIENRNGKAHLTADLDAEQLKAVMEALAKFHTKPETE